MEGILQETVGRGPDLKGPRPATPVTRAISIRRPVTRLRPRSTLGPRPKSAAKESSPSAHQIAPYPYPYPIIASRAGRGMGKGRGSDGRVIIKQLLNLDDWLHCDETTSQSAREGLLVSMRLS